MIEVTFDSPQYVTMGTVFIRTLFIGLIAMSILPVLFRSFGRNVSSIIKGVIAALIVVILGFFTVLSVGGFSNSGMKREQNEMLTKELPSIIKKEFDDISTVEASTQKEGYFLVKRENGERASVSIQNEKPGKKPFTTVYTLVLNEPKPEKPAKDDKAKDTNEEGIPKAGIANPTQEELDAARVSNKPGYKNADNVETSTEKAEVPDADSETEKTAKSGIANPTQEELDTARASNKDAKSETVAKQ